MPDAIHVKPQISERARIAPPSPIRKLTPFADKAKAEGVRVLHVNIGQPDLETPAPAHAAVEKPTSPVIAYAPSHGMAPMREAWLSYYGSLGHRLKPNELLVTTAGSEALLFALMAVASPGEDVVVFEPFYPNDAGFAVMAGIHLVPVATQAETGHALPPIAEIEAALTDKTRAILINSPNNPTGAVYTREAVAALAELCVRRGLFLISDEVYREYAFGEPAVSALSFPDAAEHVIVIDSVSKRWAACGLRIGCIVSRNAEIMDACNRFAMARLSSPTLGQLAATALASMDGAYVTGIREEYRRRRDAVVEGLGRIPGAEFVTPTGAFYLMARLPVGDAEAFAAWLLTDFRLDGTTVMVAPGPGFYITPGLGREEIRIAFVLDVPKLTQAMDILAAAVTAWNARGK